MTITDEGIIEHYYGVPDFVTPPHGTFLDATYAVKWSGIELGGPRPLVARYDLHPGDVIQSSRGIRLYITRVKFRVTSDPGQMCWIEGRHPAKGGQDDPLFTENYTARSTVPLISRGGVTFDRLDDGSLPFVPVTPEEKRRSASIADGRTIDRMLEPDLTAYRGGA